MFLTADNAFWNKVVAVQLHAAEKYSIENFESILTVQQKLNSFMDL